MASYRISFFRAQGWTRAGLALAAFVLFSAPMLWALGWFGASDEAMHRAIIYALSGLWAFVALGYLTGWALQGFVIRQKVADEDAEDGPPAGSHRPTPPLPPKPGAPAKH
jgi:fatty acid desaturase